MNYTLNFSLKLEKHDSCIIYSPEEFADQPISISVPDVVELLEIFLNSFEEAGIVENISDKNLQGEEEKGTDDIDYEGALSKQKSVSSTNLKGLSGKAFVRKSKDLDEIALDKFCSALTEYMRTGCSELSPENFLSEENNLYFSGLMEVLELRNYLARYTKNRKRANGYLYIMAI